MADYFWSPNRNPLAIAVQQGLFWDAEIAQLTRKKLFRTRAGERMFRLSRQLRGVKRFENCYNRVAVDLYFVNWYRSFRGIKTTGRIWHNANPVPRVDWNSDRDRAARMSQCGFYLPGGWCRKRGRD